MIDARVLIADDDPDIRELLREALAEAGAEVAEADSGVELLRVLAEQGPFDLVITDVRMSWATGAQVLSMARLAGYNTPFVVITAYLDEELRASVESLGATLLYKPIDVDHLLQVARRVRHRHARPASSANQQVVAAGAVSTPSVRGS